MCTEMEARKEQFKQSVRGELALANAQQLINVSRVSFMNFGCR